MVTAVAVFVATYVLVAEAARPIGGLGFWEYLRIGFPLAIATTALGTAWLLAFG